MAQYKTIKGQEINGLVINRYEKTMSVAADDGGTYLCWLVGEAQPMVSFQPSNLKQKYSEVRIACRAIFPNGEFVDFMSIKAAADHYRMSSSTISRQIKNGEKLTSGKLKGVRFERVVENERD